MSSGKFNVTVRLSTVNVHHQFETCAPGCVNLELEEKNCPLAASAKAYKHDPHTYKPLDILQGAHGRETQMTYLSDHRDGMRLLALTLD